MIYYIGCPATGAVKIGYTRGEPEVRLKQLQTGSAATLRLVACHEGTQADEREIHQKLADHRLRGEWFEASEAVLSHISSAVMLAAIECLLDGAALPHWTACALRALRDQNGSLPPFLEELL